MTTVARRRGVLLLLAGALALAAIGLLDRSSLRWLVLKRPNVLIIMIDTLRADRVLPDPTGKSTMPFLADYASRALSYERAYAPSSWTLPSVVSLFTGQYPSTHGVGRSWFYSKLPSTANTLASVFLYYGYSTFALSAHQGVSGPRYGHGFQHFEVVGPEKLSKRDAQTMHEAVVTWLDTLPAKTRSWFLYLHYMDMHSVYRFHPGLTEPRGDDVGRSDKRLGFVGPGALAESDEERRQIWNFTPREIERIRQLYDGEARYVDRRLAALFAELENRGALENTIVVITSDHGEEFGEHELFAHGASLYEPVIHVPLIIKIPGRPAQVIREPVQMAALATTLMGLLDIPPPDSFRIPPLPLREPEAAAAVYSELPENVRLKVRVHDSALIMRDAKLLVTRGGEKQLFDLRDDPGEQRARPELPLTADLLAAHSRLQPDHTTEAPATIELDESTIERLRGLGYEK